MSVWVLLGNWPSCQKLGRGGRGGRREGEGGRGRKRERGREWEER